MIGGPAPKVQVASLDAQQFRPLTELWRVERFPTMKLVAGGFDFRCCHICGEKHLLNYHVNQYWNVIFNHFLIFFWIRRTNWNYHAFHCRLRWSFLIATLLAPDFGWLQRKASGSMTLRENVKWRTSRWVRPEISDVMGVAPKYSLVQWGFP